MAKVKCYIKRPDEEYGHSTAVSCTLENLQRNVGGYIEAVMIIPEGRHAPGVVVICDEEGRLKHQPYNCRYGGVDFVGDILVLGSKGDKFVDVPIDWDTHKSLISR